MDLVRVWYKGQWRHGLLKKEGRKWDYLLLPEAKGRKPIKVLKGDWIKLPYEHGETS